MRLRQACDMQVGAAAHGPQLLSKASNLLLSKASNLIFRAACDTHVLLFICCRFSRTAVARVSDDYYPRDPASSTPHIGACAFNSVYLGALVQPDWDMFQSAHPAGGFIHASSSRG